MGGGGGVNTTGMQCHAWPDRHAHQEYSAATCCEPLYSSTARVQDILVFYHVATYALSMPVEGKPMEIMLGVI